MTAVLGMSRSAVISPCGAYRTRLDRIWNRNLPVLPWICHNPSKATAEIDDPSVRKMIGFTSRWGYGGFALFNVLSYRATNPRDLLVVKDPIGPGNEPWRIAAACAAFPDPPVVAWGSISPRYEQQAREIILALPVCRCLGYTKDEQPRHPLMLKYSTPLEIFRLTRGQDSG